ncbi:unnamed protein product [Hymenolepis diminuta]|uniref:Integrase_H2C2 domain-containing protein n=1 Tax=Hymenolepis diminuta TaxID=6216 RepID=A0A0R3SLW4_HYMDI|nr:unnamed protein product [Hymenolepis diminuta]
MANCSQYRGGSPIFRSNRISWTIRKHSLQNKNSKFLWTEQCTATFEELKRRLTSAPILAFPNLSNNQGTFILDTDASNIVLGAVLSQIQNSVEHSLAYSSKTLSNSEQNYCATKLELLAVKTPLQHFRHYLLGLREFILPTDHEVLTWLHSIKDPEELIAHGQEILAEYHYKLEHRPGSKHGNVNALPRIPQDPPRVATIKLSDDRSLVLPRTLVGQIVEQLRRSLGHLRAPKIEQAARQRYWWSNMRGKLDAICAECQLCERANSPNHQPRGPLQPMHGGFPNEIIGIDQLDVVDFTNGDVFCTRKVKGLTKFRFVIGLRCIRSDDFGLWTNSLLRFVAFVDASEHSKPLTSFSSVFLALLQIQYTPSIPLLRY